MLAKGDLVRWYEYYSCLTTVRKAGIGIIVMVHDDNKACTVLRSAPYEDVFVFDKEHIDKINLRSSNGK